MKNMSVSRCDRMYVNDSGSRDICFEQYSEKKPDWIHELFGVDLRDKNHIYINQFIFLYFLVHTGLNIQMWVNF